MAHLQLCCLCQELHSTRGCHPPALHHNVAFLSAICAGSKMIDGKAAN
jgi:hypothetical protein